MAKVLVVDDDPFILKMYVKKFQIAGFEVDSAANGETGLAKIKSFKPDLVLLDVMMPKMNGLEVLEKAKADPDIKSIPVLILTNLSSTSDAQEAVKKGAIDFMIKSNFTPSQIVTKAKKILHIS